MPDRRGPVCAICGVKTAWNWNLCKPHSREWAEFKKRPAWVTFLVLEEKKRRYRMQNTTGYKREYSEKSLDALLSLAKAKKLRVGEGGPSEFLYKHGAYTEMEECIDAESFGIEVLKRLTPEERNLVLLKNALEFGLPDIGKIIGCSYSTTWKRWIRCKKRLTAIRMELNGRP